MSDEQRKANDGKGGSKTAATIGAIRRWSRTSCRWPRRGFGDASAIPTSIPRPISLSCRRLRPAPQTFCWSCSTTSASVRRARLADQRTRRRCNGWPIRVCATTAFTPPRSARRRGRRCSRVAITTPSTRASSRKWRPGFPGYDGSWPREAASIAEILRGNHYSTAAFGKWHNTPDHELSAAGPFDRWPTGKGFDYWYGFQGGEASQWHTPLFENTAPIEPPHDNPHWHFSEAIAEKAISWISQQKAGAPEKPFFVVLRAGSLPQPAPCGQGMGRQVQGTVRSRLGSSARDHARESEDARPRSRRTRS